ncbi:hypothetical protein [Vibrio phage BONAISHI]|nr:hypothetical protein [Vibrio phage BONAISHI]
MYVSLESFIADNETPANTQTPPEQLVDGCELSLEHIDVESDVRVPADADFNQLEFQLQMANATDASLARLEQRLTASLENGGIATQHEAQAFADQYAAATESFGVHVVEVPAVESFAEEGMAEAQTRVAVEGVKEMAATAGKAIKSLLDAIIAQVKKLATQYFTRAGRARKALQALKTAAGQVKGNPVEKEVSISNARYIKVEGKISLQDYASRVVAGSSGLDKAFKEMTGQLGRIDSGNPSGSLQSLENTEQAMYTAVEKMFDATETASEAVAKKAGFKADSYQKLLVSKVMPGGAVVVVAIPKADSGRPVAVKHVFAEEAGDKDSKVAALASNQLGGVIDEGLKLLDSHDAIVTEMQKLSGLAKDASAAGQKAAKEIGKIKDNESDGSKLVGFLKDMKPRLEVTYVVHKALSTQCALKAAAHADYAKASIKNLKSEKANPAPKDNKDADDKDNKDDNSDNQE